MIVMIIVTIFLFISIAVFQTHLKLKKIVVRTIVVLKQNISLLPLIWASVYVLMLLQKEFLEGVGGLGGKEEDLAVCFSFPPPSFSVSIPCTENFRTVEKQFLRCFESLSYKWSQSSMRYCLCHVFPPSPKSQSLLVSDTSWIQTNIFKVSH